MIGYLIVLKKAVKVLYAFYKKYPYIVDFKTCL